MSLLEIKNYLMQVKMASITTLCAHFNCDSDVLRNMMAHWMRKGCIRKLIPSSGCGKTCTKCVTPPVVEIYEWVDSLKNVIPATITVISATITVIPATITVIPAKAGIYI